MTPDETGISLPRGCSWPSSTASLCARILLPIGELLLARRGASAEPATASATRAASGSRRSSAHFMGFLPTGQPPAGPELTPEYTKIQDAPGGSPLLGFS